MAPSSALQPLRPPAVPIARRLLALVQPIIAQSVAELLGELRGVKAAGDRARAAGS